MAFFRKILQGTIKEHSCQKSTRCISQTNTFLDIVEKVVIPMFKRDVWYPKIDNFIWDGAQPVSMSLLLW